MGAVCCLMRYHFWASSDPTGKGQSSNINSLRWILRLEEAQADDDDERAWGVGAGAAVVSVFIGKHCPIASWIFCRRVRLPLELLPSPSLGADNSVAELTVPSPGLAATRSCPSNEAATSKPCHLQLSFKGEGEDWSLFSRSLNSSPYSKPSLTGLSTAGSWEVRHFFFPFPPFRPLPASRLSSDRLCLTLGRAPLSRSFPRFPDSFGNDMMDYAWNNNSSTTSGSCWGMTCNCS